MNFVTDANNDTIVDSADEEKLRAQPGATLEFWEGDGERPDKALSALEDPLQILEEYVTVRIVLDDAMSPDDGLSVRLKGAGAGLYLAPHVGGNSKCQTRSFLCDEPTGHQQAALRSTRENRSTDDVVTVPGQLSAGNNDYIFRCTPSKGGGASETCTGVLEVVRDVGGVKEPVLGRQVRFRPVEELMSVFSARKPGDGTKVAPKACALVKEPSEPGRCPVGVWADLPPADEAPRVFVFVHGYAVPLENALDRWFPFVFKRLYWAGLPLIKEQKEKPEDRIHMVGFTWQGNQGTVDFLDVTPYPPNEFNAMQTAVPFGVFLTDPDPKSGVGGRHIQVMAHSLGNMVVNEAISMLPDRTVKRYIMNEAALAAEAFVLPRCMPRGSSRCKSWMRTRASGDTLTTNGPASSRSCTANG